jgi:alkanesulfonate monooxygenase SsuD/methylene tetrahydromethanopterin reductase-like flavin-dependent oxidoreductase (luciferase family)
LLGEAAHDPVAEHEVAMSDLELIVEADRHRWKYAWVTEHHALPEYSHLSASESFIPFALARTERIHVGSGIWPLNPVTNHPVRLAERAAMCDHLSEGRFEFGTGRGAGSWEVGTFNVKTSETKEVWEEVVWEFKKMWGSLDYSHAGPAFSTPGRNILPKPLGGGRTHPPMWVAAGNPPTYERAALHGMGVLGFNVGSIPSMVPHIAAYKAAIGDARPVGQFVNDNVMITSAVICLEDGQRARRAAANARHSYHLSLVYLYHDTFPVPAGAVVWPEVLPEITVDQVDEAIEQGLMICGTPSEVRAQIKRYADIGCDQLVFGMPHGLSHEEATETIRLFGDEVIPEFDTDPIHRSSRMRYGEAAEDMVRDPRAAARPFDSSKVTSAF